MLSNKILSKSDSTSLINTESTHESCSEISIYIDARLLERSKMASPMNFIEDDYCPNVPRELVEFELYAERNNNVIFEESIEEPKMSLSTQKVPNGYIINGNIFLHERNWNCIVQNRCLLCEVDCSNLKDHVSTKCHLECLEANKPIAKYDLSIVRKINSAFHCGVCNEIIETNKLIDHFEGENHQDKSLYASNKASDVIFDSNLHKQDNGNAYHFNVNNIVDSGHYFTATSKNEPYPHLDEVENAIECHEEMHPDQAGVSYASMARTPKIEHPEHVIMNVGERVIRVKFDCYHMVSMIGPNQFYCMACRVQESVRMKTTHCADAAHLRKMQKCSIVFEYRDFFVRKVDDKFYHCGICNNLQLVSDIDDHIAFRHDKAFSKTDHCPPKAELANRPEDAVKKNKVNIQKENFNGLNKCVAINLFGRRIRLLLSNCFLLIKHERDSNSINWYCIVCYVMVTDNILEHINLEEHLKRMKECPFINCLEFNCIRKVKNGFFCTLCAYMCDNLSNLTYHIFETEHTTLRDLIARDKDDGYGTETATEDYHPVTDIYDSSINRVLNAGISKNTSVNGLSDSACHLKDQASLHEETHTDVQSQDENSHSDSDSDSEPDATYTFDENAYTRVKFKNSSFQIPATCYHTLVAIDNRRHCFVCDVIVFDDALGCHVDSRQHADNLTRHGLVDKYGKHLIRQSYLLYHCATCNIVITKSLLQTHLSSELHSQLKLSTVESQSHDSSLDLIELKTQKEMVYLKGKERLIKVLFKAKIKMTPIESYDENSKEADIKLSKLIFVRDDSIIKLDWDHWHSIVTSGDSRKCLMCQTVVADELSHVIMRQHLENLTNRGFEEAHGANLIRRIDSTNVNCSVCNTQLSDFGTMLKEHVAGKKHAKNLAELQQKQLDSYDDCERNPYFFNSYK